MSRFLRNHARSFLFTTLRANNGFHNQVTESHTAPYTRPYMEASGTDRAATLVHQHGASLGADAHRRGHGEALTRLEEQLLLSFQCKQTTLCVFPKSSLIALRWVVLNQKKLRTYSMGHRGLGLRSIKMSLNVIEGHQQAIFALPTTRRSGRGPQRRPYE